MCVLLRVRSWMLRHNAFSVILFAYWSFMIITWWFYFASSVTSALHMLLRDSVTFHYIHLRGNVKTSFFPSYPAGYVSKVIFIISQVSTFCLELSNICLGQNQRSHSIFPQTVLLYSSSMLERISRCSGHASGWRSLWKYGIKILVTSQANI